ncbi:hypothetical protein [Paenibacillus polymyxa]|uniref:hypothetical protein n=1 Tax=Paenibacillus polymyxa TaxID=1406 RepID=UPI0023F97845|nr:hypothetical protein [Paenibacillus polymyxa]
MNTREFKQYVRDIQKYRDTAEALSDDSAGALLQKVTLLTKALTLIGRVSAWLNGEYKRAEAKRKNTFTLVKAKTPKGDKVSAAELAIIPLREAEAKAYERMHLWRNEFDSLKEHIHELRLRLRVDMHIGDGDG